MRNHSTKSTPEVVLRQVFIKLSTRCRSQRRFPQIYRSRKLSDVFCLKEISSQLFFLSAYLLDDIHLSDIPFTRRSFERTIFDSKSVDCVQEWSARAKVEGLLVESCEFLILWIYLGIGEVFQEKFVL